MATAGLILASQVSNAEATVPQAGAASAALALTVGVFVVKRSYEATEVIVAAAEHGAVRVIEAVSDASTTSIPIIFGAMIILLMLGLKVLTDRYWKPHKETRKDYGETPEGNVRDNDLEELERYVGEYTDPNNANTNGPAPSSMLPTSDTTLCTLLL